MTETQTVKDQSTQQIASTDQRELIGELADLIIESVNLRHVPKESFTFETVFGTPGLGLDSVDILEIVIALEQKYNFKFPDAEMARVHLKNLGALADFISKQKALKN